MTKKKDTEAPKEPRMVIASGKLIAFLDAVRAIVPECRLEITKDGLEVMAVDQGNVALTRVTMAASEFIEYGLPPMEIGLDLERVGAAMPLLGEEIIISPTKDNRRLELKDGRTTYTNALLDVNTIRKKPNIPTLRLPVGFECTQEILAKSLSAAARIQDKIILEVTRGLVLILAESSEDDKLQTALDCSKYPDKVDKARSIYSLDYLRAIVKGLKGLGTVTVNLGINTPVRFEAQGAIKVIYFMAPRIEDDITTPSESEVTAGGPPNTDKPEKKKPSVGAPGNDEV